MQTNRRLGHRLLSGVFLCLGLQFLAVFSNFAQSLPLPVRSAFALNGDFLAKKIETLDLTAREGVITAEFLAGNAPHFLRRLWPVSVTNVTAGITNIGTFFVTPDYLAIGADENYLLAPLSPGSAQRVADQLNCSLPTRKMVDAIFFAAPAKLPPTPITPSAAMTTVPIFAQHNTTVRAQRMAVTNLYPLGALTAGHKKDVVISTRLTSVKNKVAIYGWHQTNGVAIQPLYLGHTAAWVDYSQCSRLVAQTMAVNGKPKSISQVLADPKLCGLISDEGVVTNTRYSTINDLARVNTPFPTGFQVTTNFGELVREIVLSNDVRIVINTPPLSHFSNLKPVRLVFYALPNGNSIEQTFGGIASAQKDWRFNIQIIGAQTRWLRQRLTNETLVVAYLEAKQKSWPAWRKAHSDREIVSILDGVREIFSGHDLEVALTSHSGGGSLIFGYLNAVEMIPPDVRRIAFLDSNYAYNSSNHSDKIIRWLDTPLSPRSHMTAPPTRVPDDHVAPKSYLCVLAYQDYLGRLEGRPFVSEAGGTWGRSQQMLADFGVRFSFTSTTNNGLQTHRALDGRVEFLLKENPDGKILHSVQVERNGFIHALLSGTTNAGAGYEYLGQRAFADWIQP